MQWCGVIFVFLNVTYPPPLIRTYSSECQCFHEQLRRHTTRCSSRTFDIVNEGGRSRFDLLRSRLSHSGRHHRHRSLTVIFLECHWLLTLHIVHSLGHQNTMATKALRSTAPMLLRRSRPWLATHTASLHIRNASNLTTPPDQASIAKLPDLDASKLEITKTKSPKNLSPSENLVFGREFSGSPKSIPDMHN